MYMYIYVEAVNAAPRTGKIRQSRVVNLCMFFGVFWREYS